MMDEVDAKSKPGPYGRREAYRSYHSTLAAEWKGQRVRLRVGPKRDGTDAGPRPGKQMGRVALVRQCCDAG